MSAVAAIPTDNQIHLEIPGSVRAVLQPPEDLRPTQWVECYRTLPRDAADGGLFSFEKIPYMVEPTDASVDATVRSIIFIKASRCSGSELLKNVLGHSIKCAPRPAIYVLPRDDDVSEEFTKHLKWLVEDSPELAVEIPGGNWASALGLSLRRMNVMPAACTRPGDFIRRTSGLNLFDEVDNCADEAMRGRLGDVWELLEDRLTTYGHRAKQIGVSTPTTTEAAGWKAYLRSDRRKYWCPCPRCGVYQILRFSNIRLLKGHETERDPERIILLNLARYVCENPPCAIDLPDGEKLWMTQRGLWVPECQRITGRLDVSSKELVERAYFRSEGRYLPPVDGELPITRRRGYWVDAAVSPWRTFSEFLGDFFKSKDDPHKFRVHLNGWQATAWQDAVVSTDASDLEKHVALGHDAGSVPDRAVILIAAADVQGHWIHYSVYAFGPGEECWLVHDGQCETFDGPGGLYELTFGRQFPYADGKAGLSVSFLAVDSGYRKNEVYDFALAHPGEVFAVKGVETQNEKVKPSLVEYYPSGRRAPQGMKIWLIDTDFFKQKMHGLFKKPAGACGPGTFHLHRETSRAHLEQLTAEHHVYERPTKKKAKGRWVWKPKTEGRANHKGDILVYVLAIADLKNCRALPTREVVMARRSSAPPPGTASQSTGTAGGVRTPDGRPFFATHRGDK